MGKEKKGQVEDKQKCMNVTLEESLTGYKNFSALGKAVSKVVKIYQRILQKASQY